MQSKIKSIAPDGGFPGKDGKQIFVFLVTMEDSQSGVSFAFSNPPPYGVGDEVQYELNGVDNQNRVKLKVKKVHQQGGGYGGGGGGGGFKGGRQSDESKARGQRCGMALNQACETARGKFPPDQYGSQPFCDFIKKFAWWLFQTAEKMEASAAPKQEEHSAPQPPPQQQPPAPQPQQQNVPPNGQAFDNANTGLDEDEIPF